MAMHHTHDEWIERFKAADAYWTHARNNPDAPHALLRNGGHSDGFFAWSLFLKADPEGARRAVEDLFQKAKDCTHAFPGVVLGPQTGATYIAQQLSLKDNFNCAWASPKKKGGDANAQEFEFVAGCGTSPAGKSVLLVEDTLTTGGSVERSAKVAIKMGAREILPFILCMFNRSKLHFMNGRRIISVVHVPMETWDTSEQAPPHIGLHSEALRPKEGDNWARLVAGV